MHQTLKHLSSLFFVLALFACKKSSFVNAKTVYLTIGSQTLARDSVNKTLRFTITVDPANTQTISVDYATIDGTAKAGTDYSATSGTLTIGPNTTGTVIEVPVMGRKLSQGTQEFYVQLSNATNAVIKFDKATATLQNVGYNYTLKWSDEFNGTSLNTGDWNYETGGNGWGNNELQYYTSGTGNAYLQNGNLVIEAKRETVGNNNYTSARLTTKGKRKFTYGRFDIRAKLPKTKGIWPALWMLGENITEAGWPACGEIDIMELLGHEPAKTYGTVHYAGNGNHLSHGGNTSLSSGNFSDTFHVFSLEWQPDKMTWMIDSVPFYEVTRQQMTTTTYPFDKDHFFIFNVAVGGNWPGNPDATTLLPQKMYVDYIRVYQK